MTVHVPEPTVVAAAELAPVRTTCPYCGVGCGVLATPDGLGGVSIAGDPDHPSNFGRLCSKGAALGETVGLERRLLHPMIAGRRASWDDALTAVADGFARIVAEHGPDAVAFYLSGQLLTEDYYVANKLMKGFLGSSHVDTNSRLCMASSVAGHRRAFGSDTVPGCYEDLDSADLLVLVGSNAAWCHPVLFRRMQDNRRTRGARIVVIDPRRTETGDEADLFLAIAPGTDTALFCGLLVHLAETGALDGAFIDGHTSGFGDALAQARAVAPDIAATAAATGLAAREVAAFFDLFRSVEKVVTLYSQGVNQSAQGTDKVGAIINCHLATGRIGRPGLGPFSLTGQPNAMGGREVGGLANMLAAHMGFSAPEVDRVRRFWKAPRIADREGDKAVALFRGIAEGAHQGPLDHGHQPGRVPARRRHGPGRVAASSISWSSPRTCSRPTASRAARMSCCRPAAGARRTARSRIPSGASRASAPSCRLPARRSRTGGWSARWRGAWGSPMPSRIPPRPRSSPSTRRSPRSRTTAAAISTSAASRSFPPRTTTPLRRCSGR